MCSHSVCDLHIHQLKCMKERHMRFCAGRHKEAWVFKLSLHCLVLFESPSSTTQRPCCHISNKWLMSN